ncbi:MAG: hypothetical protein KGI57_11205, partial [Hyphomicrobiales bacterium]|nr:hypothetical protein [Hyphomicrobiales bacterium]
MSATASILALAATLVQTAPSAAPTRAPAPVVLALCIGSSCANPNWGHPAPGQNWGYGNSGSGNVGAFNGGHGNVGGFNGLGNASPTSGNGNVGSFNG